MLQLALLGFHGALLRFRAAAIQNHAEHGFLAATECLWWACTLDEQLMAKSRGNPDGDWYEAAREKHYDGQILRGLRYARNRTTHALPMTLEDSPGEPWPALLWQPLDGLPEPPETNPDAVGAKRYAEQMASNEVRPTLERAARWFAALQNDPRTNMGDPLPGTEGLV
jgi:hypothetical protein